MTNAHVVGRFNKVEILLSNGTKISGEVAGVDEISDLAVVKINTRARLTLLEFVQSSTVVAGDEVTALRFPISDILGDENTVTRGINAQSPVPIPVSMILRWHLPSQNSYSTIEKTISLRT